MYMCWLETVNTCQHNSQYAERNIKEERICALGDKFFYQTPYSKEIRKLTTKCDNLLLQSVTA